MQVRLPLKALPCEAQAGWSDGKNLDVGAGQSRLGPVVVWSPVLSLLGTCM